ncbi:MAG: co-chaperone GroES [bacterium]|nr:co-chaperone GroES [bacterium]
MNVKPLHDHVVVKPSSEETVTKSGIVLPDTAKEKPEQGKVVAVGPGKVLSSGQRAPMSVQVGDLVLFKKYSPDEIKVGDEEFLVIKDEDILAVVGN